MVRKLGANKQEVRKGDDIFLISYSTPVAAYIKGMGYIRTQDNYSRTTSKHINRWLEGCMARFVPHNLIQDLFDA